MSESNHECRDRGGVLGGVTVRRSIRLEQSKNEDPARKNRSIRTCGLVVKSRSSEQGDMVLNPAGC